jgi:hypothetical protein
MLMLIASTKYYSFVNVSFTRVSYIYDAITFWSKLHLTKCYVLVHSFIWISFFTALSPSR